jgi:hypothetical protein
MLMVKTTKKTGKLSVQATSDGLKEASISLTAE